MTQRLARFQSLPNTRDHGESALRLARFYIEDARDDSAESKLCEAINVWVRLPYDHSPSCTLSQVLLHADGVDADTVIQLQVRIEAVVSDSDITYAPTQDDLYRLLVRVERHDDALALLKRILLAKIDYFGKYSTQVWCRDDHTASPIMPRWRRRIRPLALCWLSWYDAESKASPTELISVFR